MRVYISGQMTEKPDLNRKAFKDAEQHLKSLGYTVINPHNCPVDSYEVCMKRDILLLLQCDAIYLLDGWSKSKGAKVEYAVACAIGLKIFNSTHEQHPVKETSIHHRLPKSKTKDGLGGYPIEINDNLHQHWHALFEDYDPDKICYMINTYFLNPEWEFICEHVKQPHL